MERINQDQCDIAGDGCFSLGMLAHLSPTLHDKGVWMYPRLFWETGVLGQVLYLEAHAVGISATGIGCFFDDPGVGASMSKDVPFLNGSSLAMRNTTFKDDS
ncbi:hypothetical protein RJ639_004392 [Escallonia herrerae]|uniref:Nitroreductase domain-containing protein n=1 Tax=Escallonia herrerae TaxID=1293975 RepID=A0AA88W1S1_9ASTE|nr:hypothetical protein RJ639_004392 [Escallonia herrerae]